MQELQGIHNLWSDRSCNILQALGDCKLLMKFFYLPISCKYKFHQKFLDLYHDIDHHQYLIILFLVVIHPTTQKISSKFANNFLSYPANRQTEKCKNITSLAEVIIHGKTSRSKRSRPQVAERIKLALTRTL